MSTKKGYAQCYSCTGSGQSASCSNSSSYLAQNIYSCPGYRLPTEAEWEYAYRAGTTTALHNGTNLMVASCLASDANANIIGWNSANSNFTTHPVSQKKANHYGLSDMGGNVAEWCNDFSTSPLVDYSSSVATDPSGVNSSPSGDRIVRGGSYENAGEVLRAAFRNYAGDNVRYSSIGFRCVRTN